MLVYQLLIHFLSILNSANACDQRPPEYMNHIWSYDIIEDKLDNGRKVRILNILDEFTKECLASDVGFHVTGHDVVEVLRYLFLVRGCPVYIRSDNGPELIAETVKEFLSFSGVNTWYIERGSPWENGYVESFHSRMRDELLDGELFLHLDEAKYVVGRRRRDYNYYRPHSSLAYMTPATYAHVCRQVGCVSRYVSIPDDSVMRETLSQTVDQKTGAAQIRQVLRPSGKWTPASSRTSVVNNFTRHFSRILKSAGVIQGTFHDLRRTAITNWFQQGLSEHDVMTLAGHSNFETTHKFYLAVADDLMERARKVTLQQIDLNLPDRWRQDRMAGATA